MLKEPETSSGFVVDFTHVPGELLLLVGHKGGYGDAGGGIGGGRGGGREGGEGGDEEQEK
jgi:hypothetical protein